MRNLKSLVDPKSIAVVGASRDRKKLGRLVLDNILKNGYKGKIYPVNPKAGRVANLKCYSSVSDISGTVDIALIAIPSQFVYQVVEDCCKKKVRNLVIITSGFSETGQSGLEEEYKIIEKAKSCGTNVMGPNCLGIISTNANLNATFAKNKVQKGDVAFLSQSGALGTAGLDWAEDSGVGFSHFISLGNKGDLSENDMLEYLAKDKKVKALALYIEDFSDGKGFIQTVSKIDKPVIVLKPGKSKAAQEALGSHTGSLAEDDLIVSSALRQAGALRVNSIEELFNSMKLFSLDKDREVENVAIITNAGGPGVITTDAIELNEMKIAELANSTQKYLAMKLPAAANYRNPVDVLGDALAERYQVAVEKVIEDDNVDAVLVILTPQVMTQINETAELLVRYHKRSSKYVVPVFLGGKEVGKGKKILEKNNIPYFNYPEEAVYALKYVNSFSKKKATKGKGHVFIPKTAKSKVEKLLKEQKGSIKAQISERVFEAYKIPVLKSQYPQDMAGARRYAKKLGYPLVLKLIHPELLHKTDVSAVKLGISDEAELRKAFSELSNLGKKLKLDGFKIQMQHMVKGALELILGVKLDQDQFAEFDSKKILRKKGFGHSILFGMGGIYTEVYKDVALGIVPLSVYDADRMIEETKVSEILKGARGKKYNIQKVKDIIYKLSMLVSDFPQISELDINPLFAKDDEVFVVDIKLIL